MVTNIDSDITQHTMQNNRKMCYREEEEEEKQMTRKLSMREREHTRETKMCEKKEEEEECMFA